ncbi:MULTISPECIES: hypothetical protein [Flammeovirga]|uniref:Uncharacterized protein n=1 Tax=Flammeovirga agarivorans TaxID=2726742 RepID=A0A7X8XW49_9BACT|nr:MULTISPECIES: hypothetical protein [Flammeovirga]NLR91906.1 hypothetical protein [Flammeovirga agarivorans]
MEKSIESIWKKGFIDQDALVAPKINALYEKKSINFVDKFIRDFKINLWGILIFTVPILIVSGLLKAFTFGVLISLHLWFVVYYGKKKLDELTSLDKTDNSYTYIHQFNDWLQELIQGYTKIYRYVYPALLILFTMGVWQSELQQTIQDNFAPEELFYGMPIHWLIILGIGAVLLCLFTKKLYYMDMNIVYGAQFRKLKDMIKDMEELKADL